MKRYFLAAAILLASIGVANTAGQKVSPVEVKTCGAGDFVHEITGTGGVNCDTPAGGSPGGTTGAIQYRDGGGLFAGAVITGLVLGNNTSAPSAYTGATCTNKFPRSQDASGAWTCEAVANTDLANSTISGISLGSNLAALTATDMTLTFSGSYTGATARTVGVNLANANTWSATQTFGAVIGAVSTQTGTTYTLATTDCGTVVRFTNSSAITLTIPDSLPAGCSVALVQSDAGQITPTVSGGATLHSRPGFTKSAGQWAMLGLTVTTNSGGSAANYIMSGDGA